jgi:hypothetical protein
MKKKHDNRQQPTVKKKNFSFLFIGFYILVLFVTSCKTIKNVTKPVNNQQNPVKELIEKVQKIQPEFNSANVSKMSLALEMGSRKVNVSASCKIRKDSAIYVSIQPFMGIEFFKVEMLPDTLRVFDKMNNRYYAVDYTFFSKKFGVNVDFYSIQSLLFGRLFCVGNKEVQADSCKLSNNNIIEYQNKSMLQHTEISADNSIKKVVLTTGNNSYQLETSYENYSKQDSVNFPQEIHLVATGQKTKASCDFSILKVTFNQNLTFRPTNPERFTKGNIENLLKK